MQPRAIGLGWMGGNRVVCLIKVSHECVVYDTHTAVAQGIVSKGAQGGTALFRRLSSRGAEPSAYKLMSAMRREFGAMPRSHRPGQGVQNERLAI